MTHANEHFGSSNGSEKFYQNRLSQIIYTDGVKEMAEKCGAYWLIDLVVSYQKSKKVELEDFQVWELIREQENKFRIKATDGNNHQIASQEIPFCDFRYDTATLWLVHGCLMLPKEY